MALRLILALSVAALLAAAGCAEYQPGPGELVPYRLQHHQQELGYQVPHPVDRRVVVLDDSASLAGTILYVTHDIHRVPSGQIRVRLSLKNATGYDRWADVKLVFFDAQMMEIERSAWQPVLFKGAEVTLVEGNSIRADVADVGVILRSTR